MECGWEENGWKEAGDGVLWVGWNKEGVKSGLGGDWRMLSEILVMVGGVVHDVVLGIIG